MKHTLIPFSKSARALLFTLTACGAPTVLAAGETPVAAGGFYAEAVDHAAQMAQADPSVQARLDAILAEADSICGLPLVKRAYSLQELRENTDERCGGIDARTFVTEKIYPRKAEIFALSMADTGTAAKIARELPLLAAAYRLTGKAEYAERVEAQLREVLTWQPLQRPGWTLHVPENDLPPSGYDGVWLSTGLGLVALVQTLQIMPEGVLPEDLTAAVKEQLGSEVERIRNDWEKHIPWFVRSHNVVTNQWIVPSGGLVVAAAYLGREAHPEAYDLGIANLTQSMNEMGEDGSAAEGAVYASHWTAPLLYLAARATLEAGDDSLSSSSFLQNFPIWLSGSYQPGGHIINCFDGFTANRGSNVLQVEDITQLAVLSQDPSLIWVLRNIFGPKMQVLNAYGLMALGIPEGAGREPPLYGVYERAAWAVWRDSWREDASGVWVRGGHKTDFHDHNDRGHVNFIVDGKAVLIEAGTPGYDQADKASNFNSVKGHNVLQIDDELFPRRQPAALTVNRLDAEGGDVTVDAGAGYRDGVTEWSYGASPVPDKRLNTVQWQRHVVWDAHEMVVTDRVVLETPGKLTFRWHLGSEQPLAIDEESETDASAHLPAGSMTFRGWNGRKGESTLEGIAWTAPDKDIVPTPEVDLEVGADQPIRVYQEKNFDHTFKFRVIRHEHTTLVVQTREAVTEFELTTVIRSDAQEQ
ncbi:MAG: heparinase II/III family protein [Verrucomicrobiota bacterium JB024]|nr:heparinase II/III family protein [Verrucomicrobiota bacterium JB024]